MIKSSIQKFVVGYARRAKWQLVGGDFINYHWYYCWN